MSRHAIAAKDAEGKIVWSPLSCSKSWQPFHHFDGPLYYANGSWVLMKGALEIVETPEGEVVSDETALAWFIRNDYEPPEEIREFATERRI